MAATLTVEELSSKIDSMLKHTEKALAEAGSLREALEALDDGDEEAER